MSPRAPTSRLFPYTTLFRSPVRDPHERGGARRDPRHARVPVRGGLRERDGEDRKSTRLNSSHLVISYAVFCLKKKKQRSRSRRQRPQQSDHGGLNKM